MHEHDYLMKNHSNQKILRRNASQTQPKVSDMHNKLNNFQLNLRNVAHAAAILGAEKHLERERILACSKKIKSIIQMLQISYSLACSAEQ